jgi:lysophospholipase L1-like esterase
VADVYGGRAHSDELGLRRRTGPEHRGVEPLRVAVLGDSVAFGYGLQDDETVAQVLERMLEERRPTDSPPVECRTVAQPGWNLRNSTSFLLDHWDFLQPDLVILLLVGNDLENTHGVLESGHLAAGFDLAQADPWLCTADAPLATLKQRIKAARAATPSGSADLGGPIALKCDLGRESGQRYDEAARLVVQLAEVVAGHDGRLLVAFLTEGHFTAHMQARLQAAAPQLPLRTLFERLEDDMTLGDDPHPSAEMAAAMATVLVADLGARGWVQRRPDAPATALSERYVRVLAPARRSDEIAALSARLREEARAELRPAVDFTTLEGIRQVYGNVNRDGSSGALLLLILPARGEHLAVELEPLAGRSDLLPIDVHVEVDGVPLGALRLEAGGPTRRVFGLPPAPAGALAREVRLVPQRSVITDVARIPQLSAFRPRRIALED